jgi:aminopeptidase N
VDFGPICLGSRLYTTLDPDDSYQTIVYYKGAWTLLNLAKMASFTPAGEAGFTDALKDMIATCKGKLMSTQDVQDAFERHMKVQVGWYFKQWLQSNVIPKVKVTTKVNGDKLSVEGTQDSQLTLPIPIETAEGKKKIREYLFFLKPGGSKQEFPLAFKPSLVAVDADRTCLADYQ